MKRKNLPGVFIGLLTIILALALTVSNHSEQREDPLSSPPAGEKTAATKVPEPGPQVDLASPQREDKHIEATESRLDTLLEAWQQNLEYSNYPEDQFLAYLFARDREKRERLLLQAYGLNPNDVLINYEIMRFCEKHEVPSLCQLPWREFLEQHEADNPYFHVEQAANAYKKGKIEDALAQMEKGREATRADFYEWRYMEMLGDSFARYGVRRTLQSFIRHYGYASAISWPDYIPEMAQNICTQKNMQGSKSFARACQAAWSNIANQEHNPILRGIANTRLMQSHGLSEEEARQAWANQYNASYAPLFDYMNSLHDELLAHFGNDEYSEEDRLQEFDELQVPISRDNWNNYLKQLKHEGHDAALVSLYEALLDQ